MVDAKPTLCYFNIKVKGEAIRMLLHHAGVEFNDVRVEFDQWSALMPHTPAGALPVWIEPCDGAVGAIDSGEVQLPAGKHYNQANAILRRLAQKHGYYSDDIDQGFIIDWCMELYTDFYCSWTFPKIIQPTATDEDLEHIAKHFGSFHAAVEKHLAEKGTTFLAGDKITVADFLLFSVYNAVARPEGNVDNRHEKARSCMKECTHTMPWLSRMNKELESWFPLSPNSPA